MTDTPVKNPIEVAVAAILEALPEQDGMETKILAAWRPKSAIRGGVWEFPGGKIDDGETPSQAAVRETREELGIDIEIVAPIAINEDIDHAQPREKHVRVHLLLARSLDGDPTISDRPWKWIPLHELAEHPWPRANARLNEALKHYLGTMNI